MNTITVKEIKQSELISILSVFIDGKENVIRFIDTVITATPNLEDGEGINVEVRYPNFPPWVIGMLIPETYYFVNIKLTTLAIIALILDINLTKGAASAALALLGESGNAFSHLKGNERCILQYILEKQSKYFFVEQYLQEKTCKYMNLDCKLRSGDLCSYDKQKLLSHLHKMNGNKVLIEENDSYRIAF
jgi:hypothetical protein